MTTENEYLVEHFSLDFDHQGERDIILLGVGMANEIAECSMMNIFYSEIPAPDGCDINYRCSVLNDIPRPYYADPDFVTCRFNCMCDPPASECEIVAYPLHREQVFDWQLCEVVIQV